MPALDQCPAVGCEKEAFLMLGDDRAWCRDHYVENGGVL